MSRNFLGIPVEGDFNKPYSNRVDQRPVEEFGPILEAVINDPTILEVGWRQYTPYFNDGDPCEFNAYDIWVRTDQDSEDLDHWELEFGYGHPSLGFPKYTRVDGRYQKGPYEGPDEDRFDRCQALNEAVAGGEFYDVLLDAFGDHAFVTVRRNGITVDTYEHD